MTSSNPFIDRILQSRWLSHLLFWGGFLFVFILLASLNSGSIKKHFINYLVLLPAQLIGAYTLVYYQVPKLLLKKKYLLFMLSFSISVYVVSIIARLSIVYIAEPLIRKDFIQESLGEILADPAYLLVVYFPIVYLMAFLLLALKTIKERFEEKNMMEILRKEKATNELKFLKSQIHPHFLFNTLNSLYALTLTKSDVAPKVVVKLSEMLDYMLYQCNVPRLAIQKEIDLIQNFMDLEKLRHGTQLELSFEHQVDATQPQIAPLILLSLVENAFKHGASGNFLNPKIHIQLTVKDERLHFEVFNTKPPIAAPQPESTPKQGIGLYNVKRQLVLNYPSKHQLAIDETDETYLVTLNIDLHD